jgi:hypothetical protein
MAWKVTSMMIETGKRYQTADGRFVTITKVDGPGLYPVVGLYDNGEEDTWTAEGLNIDPDAGQDLIPVTVKHGWCLVSSDPEWDGCTVIRPTREMALEDAKEYGSTHPAFVRVIELEWED